MTYLTTEEAARALSTTRVALLHRCRRYCKRERGHLVARLGFGMTAYKLGRCWRFTLDAVSTGGDGNP